MNASMSYLDQTVHKIQHFLFYWYNWEIEPLQKVTKKCFFVDQISIGNQVVVKFKQNSLQRSLSYLCQFMTCPKKK